MRDSPWRSALPLVAGRAGSAAIGILLPAVLARSLDRGEYGTYKQLFIVANLTLYTLQMGLSQSLFYFVPRASTDSERRTWLAQTQAMLLFLGAFAVVAMTFGAPLIAGQFSNPELARLALPIGLIGGAMVAASPLEIGLTARGRPIASAFALVASDMVKVAAMLVPVHLGYGLEGLAWGAAAAAVLKCLLSIATTFSVGAFSLDLPRIGRQLAYALPFGLAVLVAMPQQQMHQIVVASYASPELFALYSVGCMQIPIVGLLYSPVSETMQVRLGLLDSQGEKSQASGAFADAVGQLSSVFLPLCAFLIATAAPGLLILYGAEYAASIPVFQVAVASVAVSSLPVDGLLKARDRTRTLFVANVAKLAVTWPAVVLGWRSYGMLGAIGAHVAVEAVSKTALLVVVARELGSGVFALVGRGLGQGVLRALRVGAAAFAGVALGASPWSDAFFASAFAAAMLGGEWALQKRRSQQVARALRKAA